MLRRFMIVCFCGVLNGTSYRGKLITARSGGGWLQNLQWCPNGHPDYRIGEGEGEVSVFSINLLDDACKTRLGRGGGGGRGVADGARGYLHCCCFMKMFSLSLLHVPLTATVTFFIKTFQYRSCICDHHHQNVIVIFLLFLLMFSTLLLLFFSCFLLLLLLPPWCKCAG